MSKLMKVSISRKFRIDAGHRVHGHEGKCKNLHGHSYTFIVHCTAPDLDDLGRVIDFSVIKDKIGTWLDENWDHGMILWEEDPVRFIFSGELYGHKCYLLRYNPTAENLAKYLLTTAQRLLDGTEISVKKVECHETPNCVAFAEV